MSTPTLNRAILIPAPRPNPSTDPGNGQVVQPAPPGRPSGDAVEPAATGQAAALPVAPSSAGQPGGARLVAWSAFGLGIAASVAANVAHAHPALGPRIAAAFAPVALLLAVECMIRPRWGRAGFWWGLTRYGGTGLVALVAAVMSYRHMCALLVSYGEDQLNAAIGPLAVDGLMVVAGFALLAINHPNPKEDNR